ncbi:MAG: TRAP transporter small permease [Defluviicoccus sp.]|nr:TRAP transporter small permease [Defluviicoccus sp.]
MNDSSQENGSALERITDAVHPFVSAGVVTLPRLIIGSLILFGIAVNFGNVLGRYLFLAPIVWAEEIMIYSMVWMVFIGAVLVSWDGHHLKMDFFSIMMPSPFKEIMNFTGVACFLLVCIFVLPQTFTVTELMYRLDQRSVVAEIPMVIPHFAILLGFIMMFVVIVWRFRRLIKGDLASEVEELVAATEQQQDIPLNRGASG